MQQKRFCGLVTTMALGLLASSAGSAAMITGNVYLNGTAAVSGSAINFYNTPRLAQHQQPRAVRVAFWSPVYLTATSLTCQAPSALLRI